MPNPERIRLFQRVKDGDMLVLNVEHEVARLDTPGGTTQYVDYHEAVRWCKTLWRLQEKHARSPGQAQAQGPSTNLTRILVETGEGVQLALSYLIRERDHPHDVFH